jgi:hypothetical protein
MMGEVKKKGQWRVRQNLTEGGKERIVLMWVNMQVRAEI